MKGFKEKLISLMKEFGILASEPEKAEEKVAYELVYEPNTVDSHGHWMSEETIQKACENFNKNLEKGIVKSNLFHVQDTELFTVEDTWIQKEFDVSVEGTGEKIKAGSWVAKVKYNDDDLWQLKKSGVLGGVSIGGKGKLIEETGELIDISFDGED